MSLLGRAACSDSDLEADASSITRELPGNTPFAVKAEFMQDTMAGWGDEASGLQAKIVPLVKRAVEPLIEEYFGKYSERGLHAEIR